ncbi:4311_t:CDS:2, partial [Diversispora eburnea]
AAPISILPLFNLPLIFLLVRINSVANNSWLFASLAIGAGLSYGEQSAPEDSCFANMWVLMMVGAAVAFLTLLPMIMTKYLIKFLKQNQFFNEKVLNSDENNSYTTSQFYLFLFPALWTVTWSVFRRYIPLGSWGDWAYTVNNSGYSGDPIMQITSIGGLKTPHRLQYLEDSNNNSKNIETLTVGCVLPPPGSNIKKMLKLTEILATQHNSKLILWSESAIDLRDSNELKELLKNATALAIKNKSAIGFTYTISEGFKKKNMLTLIGPDGEKVFEYQKTHPVPIAEYSTESGPGGNLPIKNIKLHYKSSKDTMSINVSGAICLDVDFPELLSTAADADILLQPSQTWSSRIGLQHLRMASTRAIENGYWVLRCDGGGASGLIDPLGRIRHVEFSSEANNIFSFDLPLILISNYDNDDEHIKDVKKIHTIYSKFGDLAISGCIISLFLLKVCWVALWSTRKPQMEEMWEYGTNAMNKAKEWAILNYDQSFKNVENELT